MTLHHVTQKEWTKLRVKGEIEEEGREDLLKMEKQNDQAKIFEREKDCLNMD